MDEKITIEFEQNAKKISALLQIFEKNKITPDESLAVCTITHTIPTHPITNEFGNTYEEAEYLKWMDTIDYRELRDPNTNLSLPNPAYIKNIAVQQTIIEALTAQYKFHLQMVSRVMPPNQSTAPQVQ